MAGAYFIYTLFHKVGRDGNLNNCISSYDGDLIGQYTCVKEFEVYRGVIISIYIVFCLLELCGSSSLSLHLSSQSVIIVCDLIWLLINEQGFVSSSPVTSCSFGKRRRWVIRHQLRRLQPYRRWRRRITTSTTMRSLNQIIHLVGIFRSMSELGDENHIEYMISCSFFKVNIYPARKMALRTRQLPLKSHTVVSRLHFIASNGKTPYR